MNDKLTVRDIVDSIMEYSYTVDIAVNENEIGDAIDNFESQIYKVVIDEVEVDRGKISKIMQLVCDIASCQGICPGYDKPYCIDTPKCVELAQIREFLDSIIKFKGGK